MTHETAKIPLDMPPKSPMAPSEAQLMSLHTAAVGSATGHCKSRPTITKQGQSGFDGSSGNPGKPGEPV